MKAIFGMSAVLDAVWRRRIKRGLISGGLATAHALNRLGMMKQARGRGAIFTLHHVRPFQPRLIEPNRHLEVSPQFLEAAIARLSAEDYDFIALSDIPARLANPPERPFACFTLDDGYRNNAQHALPVFERHGVPFTIFINEGFADRTHSIWWETLASLLNTADHVRFNFGTGEEHVSLATIAEKHNAFDRFCLFILSGDEAGRVAELDALALRHGIDPLALTASLTMDREELNRLARHPLVSLGAHTVSHRALSKLSRPDAAQEMQRSADWLQEVTGTRPMTIAYPYGSPSAVSSREQEIARELGFSVAVTTQPGTVCERLANRLTALPRISLNGYYQEPNYVTALASGIPFVMGQR